jgi:hypothetical protein
MCASISANRVCFAQTCWRVPRLRRGVAATKRWPRVTFTQQMHNGSQNHRVKWSAWLCGLASCGSAEAVGDKVTPPRAAGQSFEFCEKALCGFVGRQSLPLHGLMHSSRFFATVLALPGGPTHCLPFFKSALLARYNVSLIHSAECVLVGRLLLANTVEVFITDVATLLRD